MPKLGQHWNAATSKHGALDVCLKSITNNGYAVREIGGATPLTEAEIRAKNYDLGSLPNNKDLIDACITKFRKKGLDVYNVQEETNRKAAEAQAYAKAKVAAETKAYEEEKLKSETEAKVAKDLELCVKLFQAKHLKLQKDGQAVLFDEVGTLNVKIAALDYAKDLLDQCTSGFQQNGFELIQDSQLNGHDGL